MSGLFNHDPAEVVAQLLIDLGLGFAPTEDDQSINADPDWATYSTDIPDQPDRLIGVRSIEGIGLAKLQPTGEIVENHGLTITVRSIHPTEGYQKANLIAITLDEELYDRSVVLTDWTGTGSTSYNIHCLYRTSRVLPIGKETPTSKRRFFIINYLVTIRLNG